MKTALYARVSTYGQTVENQLVALRAEAARRDWDCVEFLDVSSGSGAKRPQFELMVEAIQAEEVQTIAAWDVSRLGRSLAALSSFIDLLQEKKCDLVLLAQGFDTTSSSGRALFGVMSVFSELEKNMISERTLAGLDRAKKEGTRLGRPKVIPEKVNVMVRLRRDGMTFGEIGKAVGCSKSTAWSMTKDLVIEGKKQ